MRVDQHGQVDAAPSLYRGHRFPVEIINHCVWLYYRFPLSLRDIEEMMAQRGVIVSYETIHQWCRKFGQSYANGLRRRRARPGDKWHLDEVFIKIAGKTHYLWRAVDQAGTCSTFWSPPCETPRPPPGSSASCSKAHATYRPRESIAVETGKQTAPCTPSSYPDCAGTPAAATTSNVASPKARLPAKRSAA
jgi:DDE superfamily endonuclease